MDIYRYTEGKTKKGRYFCKGYVGGKYVSGYGATELRARDSFNTLAKKYIKKCEEADHAESLFFRIWLVMKYTHPVILLLIGAGIGFLTRLLLF